MAVFPVGLWGRTKARMALILFPPTVLWVEGVSVLVTMYNTVYGI
jgi:hypothetical protein